MKKVLLALFCFGLLHPAFAQKEETLFSGHVSHGGFGGPIVKFSDVAGEFGVLVGGRGGWIINFRRNHSIVLGGGGYGLSTETLVNDLIIDGRAVYMTMGYGGFELEYVNHTRKLVHFSIPLLLGGGAIDYRYRGGPINFDLGTDEFFVVEPGLNLMLNVTRFFRIGGGVSYRFVNGVNLTGVTNDDLSGVAGVLTFKFGSF